MRVECAICVALGACYHPASETACDISCAASPCPGDLMCGANGRCHEPTAGECASMPALDASDAPADVMIDDSQVCQSTRFGIIVCMPPNAPSVQLGASIDTDVVDASNCTSKALQGDGSEVCVIAATKISIDSTTVRGSRPLVLFATDTITIDTLLDVSSHIAGQLGAGMGNPSCSPNISGANANMNVGGGGGAGGTYYGTGGIGGDGGGNSQNAGGGGAALAGNTAPTTLHGGCSGGGGGHDGGSTGGLGGAGGGAVYLFAPTEVDVVGKIDVSGAGGARGTGTLAEGGGGGGAGGMIAIETASLVIETNGLVLAGGGGGGGAGYRGGSTLDNSDGHDPAATFPITPAAGGTAMTAGAGGGGSDRLTPPGGGAGGSGSSTSFAGGGGGGGGGGYILMFPSSFAQQYLDDTRVSPPPQ